MYCQFNGKYMLYINVESKFKSEEKSKSIVRIEHILLCTSRM